MPGMTPLLYLIAKNLVLRHVAVGLGGTFSLRVSLLLYRICQDR